MSSRAPLSRILCIAAALAAAASARSEPLSDPTRPVAARAVQPEDLSAVHVQAIVSRAGSRVAIVDGKVVRSGDHVANILIEEVLPDGVRYSQDGHESVARLVSQKLPVRRAPGAERDVP